MKVISRVARFTAAGVIAGGFVYAAAPVDATTTVRGNTALLTCQDVVNLSQVKDSAGAGIDQTLKNLKVSGISHTEKALPGAATYDPKYEIDVNAGTKDTGDTDSCSGELASPTTSRWAGFFAPNTPIQNTPYNTGTIDEIVKVAGALNGRATLDDDTDNDTIKDDCGDPSVANTSGWTLHGKLVIEYGNDGAGNTPLTVASLDALAKKVGSQVYLHTQTDNAPDNTATPPDADLCPDTADLIAFRGIVIKGVGNGAWYDSRGTFRPPTVNLAYALEVTASPPVDITMDTIIGEPPSGGLKTIVVDTDQDETAGGGTFSGGLAAHHNNSLVLSMDL